MNITKTISKKAKFTKPALTKKFMGKKKAQEPFIEEKTADTTPPSSPAIPTFSKNQAPPANHNCSSMLGSSMLKTSMLGLPKQMAVPEQAFP